MISQATIRCHEFCPKSFPLRRGLRLELIRSQVGNRYQTLTNRALFDFAGQRSLRAWKSSAQNQERILFHRPCVERSGPFAVFSTPRNKKVTDGQLKHPEGPSTQYASVKASILYYNTSSEGYRWYQHYCTYNCLRSLYDNLSVLRPAVQYVGLPLQWFRGPPSCGKRVPLRCGPTTFKS